MKNYQDILYLPHHVSEIHRPMPRGSRAAQFAPFAALTGYGEAIGETVRQTDDCIALDEDEKDMLDRKLQILHASLAEKPLIRVTYFLPDERKAGGAYFHVSGNVERLDIQKRILVLADRTAIPLERICSLDGVCFSETQPFVD